MNIKFSQQSIVISLAIIFLLSSSGCQTRDKKVSEADLQTAANIKSEFLRSWNAYKTLKG
jgi:hypothetical protein